MYPIYIRHIHFQVYSPLPLVSSETQVVLLGVKFLGAH